MKTCPNRNSPEWKSLESRIGAFEAMRDFMENNETVRSLDEILKDKPDLEYKNTLRDSEPAVNGNFEMFNSNTSQDVKDNQENGEAAVVDYFESRGEIGQDANYLENPITLDSNQNSNTDAIAFSQKLANKLASKIKGVNVMFVTAEAAQELLSNTKTPYNGESGFFLGDTVYFVQDRLNTELVFHEFAHPIVRSIAIQNPELFKKLYDQLSLTEEGKTIIAQVSVDEAGRLDMGSPGFMEEAIVRSLAKNANAAYANKTAGFMGFIKELFYAIKQFFRKIVFNDTKIEIDKLSSETTMAELSKLFMTKEFEIAEQAFSEKDIAAFSSENKKLMVDTLNYIENEDINKISKAGFDLMQKQAQLLSTRNFKEIKSVLSDKLKRSDVSEILTNLRRFQNVTQVNFSSEEKEIEYKNAHALAIINSLLRLQVIGGKAVDELKRLSKDVDNKESLRRAAYLNSFIRDWLLYLEDISSILDTSYYRDEITVDNKLKVLVNSIQDTLKRGKLYTDIIYTKGVTDVLLEQLDPLKEEIEEFYKKTIDKLKGKNAPAELIARYESEFNELKLTPEKITSLLKGEMGDSGPFNSFFEGYMNNQDPVIFGFAGYVKDRFTVMSAEIQQNYNRFLLKIEPLLKKAGYNTAYSRMMLGKDITVRDIIKYKINEGETDKAVHRFLTPWVGYEADLNKLEQELEAAKKKKVENNTAENNLAYIKAIAAHNEFLRKYMHQDYIDEYYDLQLMFADDIGIEADSRRRQILNDIHSEYTAMSAEEILDRMDSVDAHWKRYKQLFSYYYEDGTEKPKDSIDYKVAQRLQEYKKASSKFYKWTPRANAFQSAYTSYLQLLEDTGYKRGTKRFNNAREKWLEKNLVRKLTPEFFEKRSELYAQLALLQSDNTGIIDVIERLSALLAPYKDQNFIPVGSEMPEKVQEEVLQLDKELRELRNKAKLPKGLTTYDFDTYRKYQNKVADFDNNNGPEPTLEESEEYNKILQKIKKSGLNPTEVERQLQISKVLSEIFALSSKKYTDDYIDTLNDILTNDEASLKYIKENMGISQFSTTDEINTFLLKEKSMVNLAVLLKKNPKFNDWFFRNHIGGKKNKNGIIKYSPSRAWTYDEPNDSSYLEKTVIYDNNGNVVEELQGVPSIKFSFREVKDEYKTEKITYLDCIQQGRPLTDATVTMKGAKLPKLSGGDKYRNEAFFNMQKNEKAKFDLLLGFLEEHLGFQETLPYDSRLDIDIPRYRKTEFEIYTGVKQNPISGWFKRLKALYSKTADDLEEGMNPAEMATANKADLYDESMIRIPITGMYDIEDDQVSLDVIRGMARYQQSAIRQKTLIDMLPTARALQAIVQNPDNDPNRAQSIINTQQKLMGMAKGMLYPEKQKGLSIRAQAINTFIEREFEGKSQAGFTKNMVGLNKAINQLFSLSSRSFFALNIPSSYKNSIGMRFQSMIESVGGQYFNLKDYSEGSIWAVKATSEISMQLYKFGPKSLDVQLVEMMDPSQGRLTSKISQGTSSTRSLGQDIADLGFLTNHRKWGELNTTLSVFGALMGKKLIEQTMPDGSKRMIKYRDAWEIVDRQIQLKQGIDKSYDKDGAEYKKMVRKIHGVINRLNGAYASFDQPAAGRYLLYRAIMTMKTYFINMFMHRWQFKVRVINGKRRILPRYDANLNTLDKGYYIEFLQWLAGFFRKTGNKFAYMTDPQKIAARKVGTELFLIIALEQLVVRMLFGFDPDDDDKYEKLRQKSGPLPGLFVAEDSHDFNFNGWMSNHLLNLALQVRVENESWIPWPGMGLKDYLNMLKFNSISLNAVFDYYANFITGLYQYIDYGITGDTTALYKREVGPYKWQQQEGLKFINHAAKSFGITGKSIDPIIDIQGTMTRESKD